MLIALLVVAFLLLGAIIVFDVRTQMIPDELTIPFVAVALFAAVTQWPLDIMSPAIILLFFGALSLWKEDYLGSADLLVGLGMGLLLNDWELAVLTLMLTYMIGAAIALPLLLTGYKKRGQHIPFTPFLAAGGIISFIWGSEIIAVFF